MKFETDWHPKATLTMKCYMKTWQVLPVELTRLSFLEKLYIDNNKLSVLPPEVGDLKNLKVLTVDNNMLVSVPG